MVNRKKQSTINAILDEIKKTSSSSIYMQVTGTPQAILLQTIKSGWRPYFTYYFEPGMEYLGGNYFFGYAQPPSVIFTDNDEAAGLLLDDEFPENGLKTALIMHLITSAHIFLEGGSVCNFLIHPSIRIDQHSKFAEKIGDYLNEISYEESETLDAFKMVYNNLKETKRDIQPFEVIFKFICNQLENDLVSVLVLNSVSSYDYNVQYEKGINIIVGGNSLGRGVTFPKLQTIYYCRIAKNPQADTMWQHSRMFGYDRDPLLIRVFMPPILYKLFSDINSTNNSIIAQIKKLNNNNDIKIYYPKGLKPTRKNVLDKKMVRVFSGGVNYFPFYPINKDIHLIDKLLNKFSEGSYLVSLKIIVQLLEQTDSETNDWSMFPFIGFINTFIAENPLAQGRLIVRRNRDIARGTGTLLSPNDRKLGDEYTNEVVVTMYKVTGIKGWNGEEIWIPNIKLPGNIIYYSGF
jgi:hypothetical protein